MRVLLVEDDIKSASYIANALRENGHVCEVANDGDHGLALAQTDNFDVLILDRMLPRRDGLSIVEDLRRDGNRTPVLILSALAAVDDRVAGLRAGGDDYLTKPFAISELLARTEALIRRYMPEEANTKYIVNFP